MKEFIELIKMIRHEPEVEHGLCQSPVVDTTRHSLFLKRGVDIVGAMLGLLLTLPLWLLAVILIQTDDRGPLFFCQVRVGRLGKLFYMAKFRSMIVDADARKKDLLSKSDVKGAFKLKNDPRVTRAGRVLRRYKIDEFPQLLNVLIGNMSLVGPRPTSVEEVKRAYDKDTCRKFFSTLKPGVTGLTQVKESVHGKMDLQEQIKQDLYYIKNQNTFFDLMILFLTPLAILFGRGNH